MLLEGHIESSFIWTNHLSFGKFASSIFYASRDEEILLKQTKNIKISFGDWWFWIEK